MGGRSGALALYFLISAWLPRLQALNNTTLTIGILCCIGIELILRLSANMLPISVVSMLPASAQASIMGARGYFTFSAIQGDGLFYRYKPHWSINNRPWVNIDRNGFRNPDDIDQPDVVVLGDSTSINLRSKKDFGALLREKHISAINLGFSGYGPYLQLDAYRNVVIKRNLPHKLVLVNFCLCNDVSDAQNYERSKNLNLDWRTVRSFGVTKTAFPFSFEPPWVVSVIANLPHRIVQDVFLSDHSEPIAISLPRGKLSAPTNDFRERKELFDAAFWVPASRAIVSIIRTATKAGAKTIIGLYPQTAMVYAEGLKKTDPRRIAAEKLHRIALDRLNAVARPNGATVFDYAPAIQRVNRHEQAPVFEFNYHPGPAGIAAMVETARSC